MVAAFELVSEEDGCVMQASLSRTSAVFASAPPGLSSAPPSISPSWKSRQCWFLPVIVLICVFAILLSVAAPRLREISRGPGLFGAQHPALFYGGEDEEAIRTAGEQIHTDVVRPEMNGGVEVLIEAFRTAGEQIHTDVVRSGMTKKKWLAALVEENGGLDALFEDVRTAKNQIRTDVEETLALSEDQEMMPMYTLMGADIGQLNVIGVKACAGLDYPDHFAELQDPSLNIFSTMKWQRKGRWSFQRSNNWSRDSDFARVGIQFVVFLRSALTKLLGEEYGLADFAARIRNDKDVGDDGEQQCNFFDSMGRFHHLLTSLAKEGKQPILDLGLGEVFTQQEIYEMISAQLHSASEKLSDGEDQFTELSEERKKLQETARRLDRSFWSYLDFGDEISLPPPSLSSPRLFVACLVVMDEHMASNQSQNPAEVLNKHFEEAVQIAENRVSFVEELRVAGLKPWILGHQSKYCHLTVTFLPPARREETISIYKFYKEQKLLDKAEALARDPGIHAYYTLIGTENSTEQRVGQLNELHFEATETSEKGRVARLTDPSMGIFSAVRWHTMINHQVIEVENSADLTDEHLDQIVLDSVHAAPRVQLKLPGTLTELVAHRLRNDVMKDIWSMHEFQPSLYDEMIQVFRLLQRFHAKGIGAVLHLDLLEVLNHFELLQMRSDQLVAAEHKLQMQEPTPELCDVAIHMSEAHQRVNALVNTQKQKESARLLATGSRFFVKCLLVMDKYGLEEGEGLKQHIDKEIFPHSPLDSFLEKGSLVDDLGDAKNLPDVWIGGQTEGQPRRPPCQSIDHLLSGSPEDEPQPLEQKYSPKEEDISVLKLYEGIRAKTARDLH